MNKTFATMLSLAFASTSIAYATNLYSAKNKAECETMGGVWKTFIGDGGKCLSKTPQSLCEASGKTWSDAKGCMENNNGVYGPRANYQYPH